MSIKPALSLSHNSLKTQHIPSPFWTRPNTKKSTARSIFKFIWKWTKLAIFAFFLSIGLWGCFQSMWDVSISTNKVVGAGMEFGYAFGTTGDYRYDLSATYGYEYATMDNFTMSYGPFYGLFVYPGAMLVMSIMYPLRGSWGGLNGLLGIFTLLLIIRMISLMVTLRSTMQSERMSEVQGKIADINAKYKDMKDMQSRQMKQQETMEIYKKYNIKPFAAFEQMFITLPIFMVVYRVVTILRPLKCEVLFGIWNFAATPVSEVMGDFLGSGWHYIFLMLIILPSQFLSMWLPKKLASKRSRIASATSNSKAKGLLKKNNMINIIYMGVMCVMVCVSATGVGVYWFFNALFGIFQSWVMHTVIMRSRVKKGKLESRLARLGIE